MRGLTYLILSVGEVENQSFRVDIFGFRVGSKDGGEKGSEKQFENDSWKLFYYTVARRAFFSFFSLVSVECFIYAPRVLHLKFSDIAGGNDACMRVCVCIKSAFCTEACN